MRELLLIILCLLVSISTFSQKKGCVLRQQSERVVNGEFRLPELNGKQYSSFIIDIKGVEPFLWWIEPQNRILKTIINDNSKKVYVDISQTDSLYLTVNSYVYSNYVFKCFPRMAGRFEIELSSSDTVNCLLDTLIHIDAVDRWVYLGSRCRDSINRDTVVDSIESATVVSKEETVPSKNFIEEAFGLNMEMVYVEGGVFDYGVKRDELKGFDIPLRKDSVIENDFWIGKYEVTIEQWYAVMQDPSVKNAKCPTCPITGISQDAALAFCGKLSEKTESQMAYGLPFEIQWEYAAKGGVHHDTTLFSGSNHLDSVAWYYANSRGEPHDVYDSSKKPNSLGIYGMTGNAAEWCADCDIIDGNVRPYSRGGGYDKDEYRSDVYYYITNRDRKRSEDRFQGFRVMCAPKKGDEENNSNTQPIQTP